MAQGGLMGRELRNLGRIAAVFALAASGSALADYQSSCAGCHATTAGYTGAAGQKEVNFLPNSTGSSGSIRAANNRSYLDSKIAAGMGGLS